MILLIELFYEVGEELNINEQELWLNDSVKSLNAKPDIEICEKIVDKTNL